MTVGECPTMSGRGSGRGLVEAQVGATTGRYRIVMELIDLVPNSMSFRVITTIEVDDEKEIPTGFTGRVRRRHQRQVGLCRVVRRWSAPEPEPHSPRVSALPPRRPGEVRPLLHPWSAPGPWASFGGRAWLLRKRPGALRGALHGRTTQRRRRRFGGNPQVAPRWHPAPRTALPQGSPGAGRRDPRQITTGSGRSPYVTLHM